MIYEFKHVIVSVHMNIATICMFYDFFFFPLSMRVDLHLF